MSLTEAIIYRQPDYVLRSWQVGVLRIGLGSTYVVRGFDCRDGDAMESGVIRFFDSERQLMLDVEGVVWLIPAREHYASSFWNRTEQVVNLIAQPRHQREIPSLTAEQEQELHRLVSRKSVY